MSSKEGEAMKRMVLFIIVAIATLIITQMASYAEEPAKKNPAVFTYECLLRDGEKEIRQFTLTKKGKVSSFSVLKTDRNGRASKEKLDSDEVVYLNVPEGLTVGKSWSEEYRITEIGSRFRATKANCEAKKATQQKVPAGEFQAIKIECDLENQIGSRSEGIHFASAGQKVFWYAPEIKMPVSFSDDGKNFRLTKFE